MRRGATIKAVATGSFSDILLLEGSADYATHDQGVHSQGREAIRRRMSGNLSGDPRTNNRRSGLQPSGGGGSPFGRRRSCGIRFGAQSRFINHTGSRTPRACRLGSSVSPARISWASLNGFLSRFTPKKAVMSSFAVSRLPRKNRHSRFRCIKSLMSAPCGPFSGRRPDTSKNLNSFRIFTRDKASVMAKVEKQ